jgi:hypothetical protein
MVAILAVTPDSVWMLEPYDGFNAADVILVTLQPSRPASGAFRVPGLWLGLLRSDAMPMKSRKPAAAPGRKAVAPAPACEQRIGQMRFYKKFRGVEA